MTRDDLLDWLERWYVAHCDGEWEHEHGVDIGALTLVREALEQ